MVYCTTRGDFKPYLNDTALTLLVFVDDVDEQALAYHDIAKEGVTEPWRVPVLVAEGVLTPTQVKNWEASADRYVVLGGTEKERVFVKSDVLTALDRADGKPSILKIRQAFAEGDEA